MYIYMHKQIYIWAIMTREIIPFEFQHLPKMCNIHNNTDMYICINTYISWCINISQWYRSCHVCICNTQPGFSSISSLINASEGSRRPSNWAPRREGLSPRPQCSGGDEAPSGFWKFARKDMGNSWKIIWQTKRSNCLSLSIYLFIYLCIYLYIVLFVCKYTLYISI